MGREERRVCHIKNSTTRNGIVLSKSDIKRFWKLVAVNESDTECWLWLGGAPKNPYGHFSVGPRKTAKTLLAHRVSYFISKGHTNLQVCHTCDNTRCVNPKHLFAGTQLDNRQDCKLKNRTARGTKHGMNVLSESEVLQAADLHVTGMSIIEIANNLKRAETTIRHIIDGRTWSWLTGIHQKGIQ